MKIDDSFKKPGSVPFKWEIRPGVPKLQTAQAHPGRPGSEKQHQRKQKQHHPIQETPRKLKPPPAGSYLEPRTRTHSARASPQTRTHSARSSPRAMSERFGFSGLARPDVVSSAGCFPSPLGKLKNGKKRDGHLRSIPEPDYYSDLEVSTRWSVSSRKSISPLMSPYFPSHRSSPRPVYDADWAGFGLF